MSKRAGADLRQFGYDQLGAGQPVISAQIGAVQDDYILGTGDQLDVTLRGQENSEYTVVVDRDGRITLPKLAPIAAAGRRLGDFRRDFIAAVHRAYISTEGYITVMQVRQINVLVVGDVNNPGQQTLTGLSTILDALNLAGGITKSGSLRNITVVRGDRSFRVDLYSILRTHQATPDLTIAQGDRIIVPAIGATVAVTGQVRRPGIYELTPGSRAISEGELMRLGDGPELRGVYREAILTIRPDGKEELNDASKSSGTPVREGEILFIDKAVNVSLGTVALEGPVRLPGHYPRDRAKTLHDLLPSVAAFAPTPYMLMGVIVRTDPKTEQRGLIPFSPAHVIEGRENIDLISNDVVHVFTVPEMRQFAAASAQPELNGRNSQNANGTAGQGNSAQGSAAFNQLGGTNSNTGSIPLQGPSGGPATPFSAPNSPGGAPPVQAPNISSTTADQGTMSSPQAIGGVGDTSSGAATLSALTGDDAGFFGHVLSDYEVSLGGAVRVPGPYLVSPGTSLAEVLAAAGGLDSDADASGFEVTSTTIDNAAGLSTTHREVIHIPPSQYNSVVLQLHDAIFFHSVYTNRAKGEITIAGEVRYPGTYTFLRGERVSQVLVRAGGLTDIAYPNGTVYLRQSLAEAEKIGNQRTAQDLQLQIMSGLTRGTGSATKIQAVDPAAFVALQTIVDQVKNAPTLGRMTIVADPSVLAANPERDPMLEPGDSIYIPQRPNTVAVIGDVMQSGNFEFRADETVEDYIDHAGGYGQGALESMTYVVYPNGTARRVERSWLHFNSAAIPPGSVIFVPRDLFPIDWLGLTTTIATLIQGFAITAASLAVISHSN